MPEGTAPRRLGRYIVHRPIASGGMASVHLGHLKGPVGFSRAVAIKRLHPHLAKEPEFVAMFIDEARLAARIRHPNVVPTLDVVTEDGEIFLVLEYVLGEPLSALLKTLVERGERAPPAVACALLVGVLNGLHAAHEAKDERGARLEIVHRDVSPQNILVGADGVARVLDFGVAKASVRLHTTREGELKGKVAYMAPEQFTGDPITRQVDLYSAGQVLWECLSGRRAYPRDMPEAEIMRRKLIDSPPSLVAGGVDVPAEMDEILQRAMATRPADRFATAKDMARAIEDCILLASVHDVAEWVQSVAGGPLSERARTLATVDLATEPGIPDGSDTATIVERADVGTESTPLAGTTAAAAAVKPAPWRTTAIVLALVLTVGAGVVTMLVGSPTADPNRSAAGSATRPPAPIPSVAPLAASPLGVLDAAPPTPLDAGASVAPAGPTPESPAPTTDSSDRAAAPRRRLPAGPATDRDASGFASRPDAATDPRAGLPDQRL